MKDGQPFNPFGLFHGIFIPDAIKKSNCLTSHAKILMGQLLHYSGKNGKAFPSRKKLCKDLNFSRNILDRSIKLLKEEQLIKTYQLTEHSPSTYIFLYNSVYYDVTYDEKGAVLTDEKGAVLTDEKGAAITCEKHKEVNKERDHEIKRNFSTKNYRTSDKGSKDKGINGVPCGTHEPSVRNPSGDKSSCKKVKIRTRIKRHKTLANGKDEIDEHKETQNLEPVKPLPRLPKIKIEPNPLIKFNFPDQVLKILTHWKNLGGKIPKDPNRRKIADTISNQIQELLILGNNPYTPVLQDNELDQFRTKKWTVQEIKDSITYYKKELCKPIEQISFLQFILFRNYKEKDQKDFSPLVLAYQKLPQQLSYFAKKLKEDFTKSFPDVHIYDKTFIKVATFLEDKLEKYKSYQPYSGIYFEERFVTEIFFVYMNSKVIPKGTYEELRYMANPQNLKEFILWCINLNLIKSRTDQEIKDYKKTLKQKYKNQVKAYQMEIDNGTANSKWTQEKWDYFNFMKEQI